MQTLLTDIRQLPTMQSCLERGMGDAAAFDLSVRRLADALARSRFAGDLDEFSGESVLRMIGPVPQVVRSKLLDIVHSCRRLAVAPGGGARRP